METRMSLVAVVALAVTSVGVVSTSGAVASIPVRSEMPRYLAPNLPVIRLHFTTPTKVANLPTLKVSPALATKWIQIGPDDVQAVASTPLRPAVVYTVSAPRQMSCDSSCVFTSVTPRQASMATNITWEEQLLAQLNYLPVSFSPYAPTSDPSQQTSGQFRWRFPKLPTTLMAQWRVGSDNVVVRGALMNFQSVNQLPSTGVADSATWAALLDAVRSDQKNPGAYNYVTVSMVSPETLTLYVAGTPRFHTLVNTGIAVSPTAPGTYPVYLRYTSQTMSGTNPDGTHYSDPGIPWVSYFNGGDALHGFIRGSYGWPQSLGCVEMPFASAKTVWPYTPIGTLVTVQ